ncbi:MAG TPA: xanthine dehydrogenase family protein molybdopterin-binding subunit [Candidatus Angelobacter sp.]|nr:xanthine dehydrogenase family protein molybdopterin-binding subunit [Candidatus Angelobacter sp.]
MPKFVGSSVKRTEDPRLIQGLAHYVDDIKLPDTLHAVFVRSIHAHAKVKKIDTARAERLKGVVGVYTSRDVGKIGPVPCGAAIPDMKVPEHRVLATNKVYWVGHPVVMIVAETKYIARDAADLIEIDYDELPAVTDEEKAANPKSPVIHDKIGSNIAYKLTAGEGDIEAALKSADKVIKHKILHRRLAPIAMEPRGVLARYYPGEQELTLWTSTQIPHLARTQVSLMLGIPENKLRLIAPEVGGGFGSKLNVYAEEALLGWASMQTGRPVKWIEGRRENIQATIHGRGQTGYIEIGCKKDGTITGFRYNVFADMGSYFQLLTPAIPTLTGLMLSGCYKIPAIQMNVTATFTNKMSTDAYRGAGRPEATYVIERAMDLVAADLKMDPVELRRRNFPAPFGGDQPFKTATGLFYDSGNYQGALDKALKMVDYTKLRDEQKRARSEGRLFGIGVSTYVEICAMGPSPALPAGGWESATVRVEPTCKVTILTGASPHGQGQETSFAQIAADELGLQVSDVTVIHGDTAIVQYGIGTFGSRGTAVGGTAVYMSLQKLKEKARKMAAHLLGVDAAQVKFADGKFTGGGKSVTIQEVALGAHLAKNIPADMEPGLSATSFFEPKNFTFPFGTHICVVEVDRETGEIHFQRYVAVDDCGNVINPMLVHGQVHGGIVQSLGQALYEEVVYDDQGQLTSGSLMDYAVPRASHVPWFELDSTVTPSPVNPMGVKGVGEAGSIGATPAIVAAVVDAMAPLGVRHLDMPIKPENLWQIISKAKAGAA